MYLSCVCSLDGSVHQTLLPSYNLITATYLGQVVLHVPMATYLDRMLLHVAHVCSLDSSAHQTLVPSHSLIDHGNLTWSGGAACTHGNLP